MRRRLLTAILGTVALALVLSGTGTYLLLRRQAVRTTESNLRAEAQGVAALVGTAGRAPVGKLRQQQVVTGLRLEGISVLVLRPNGTLTGTLPAGVDAHDVTLDLIRAGVTLSGRTDDLVWAAAPVEGQRGSLVTVVLTRSTEAPNLPTGWFVVGGTLALAIGSAVAWLVSGSLIRPLRRASAATHRIADGDLAARLVEPAPDADDELAELARSINAMAAALETSRGLERQFLLSVSHDLRTPLTSIRGYAEAISDGTAPDPAAAARVIDGEAQRLARLVGDLLDLARLDASSFSLHLQTVPVGEVVAEASERFRPAADAAGVQLTVTEGPTGLLATIDPGRLGQVVGNLIENGLRYAGSALGVGIGPAPGGRTRIEVVDDGPGIAVADLPHVFDRLYVTDQRPARGPGSSSGLGLAIVHDLMVAMGGTVRAESPAISGAVVGGTRFVVELPPPTGPLPPP